MNYIGLPPTKTSFAEDAGRPTTWIQWLTQFAVLFNQSQFTGPTALRPAKPPYVGFQMFDVTLGKPIWAKQVAPIVVWVDATGTPV